MEFDYKNIIQIAVIVAAICILLKVTREAIKLVLWLIIIGVAIYFLVDVGGIIEYISKI